MKAIFILFAISITLFSCNNDDLIPLEKASSDAMKRDTIWLGEYNPMLTRSSESKEPYAIVTQISSTSKQYELYGVPVIHTSNYKQGFASGGENLIPAGYYICDRWMVSARMPAPASSFTFSPDLSMAGWSGQTPGNPQTRTMICETSTSNGKTFIDIKTFCYQIKSDIGGGTSYPTYLPIHPDDVVLKFTLTY